MNVIKLSLISLFVATSHAQFVPIAMLNTSSTSSSGGYFVLTFTGYKGNRSGLSGADSDCYTELTTYDWKGKSSAGTLTTARVKAFLCDSSTCNNLNASTTYYFATANNLSAGGASFTTDASGRGPGNTNKWDGVTYFDSALTYWTGRATTSSSLWSTSPSGSHCSNWSSQAGGQSATFGDPTGTFSDEERWNGGTMACGNTNLLVCFVNP